MVKFTPLGERLVIKPLEQEETTSSGLFLPDTAREKPQEGEIVAVGDGRMTDEVKRIPMEVPNIVPNLQVTNRNPWFLPIFRSICSDFNLYSAYGL